MSWERDEQIDRLLHDAVRAHGGAEFAYEMSDPIAALALIEKRDRLLKEAFNADPYRMAPAWLEHSVTDMLEEGV
jgi:hypothetical protein